MKKVIILGAGGNSKVVIDIINNRINKLVDDIKILGLLDDNLAKKSLMGYPILGTINSIPKYSKEEDVFFVNGIGDNQIRSKIAEKYPELKYVTVVHNSAIISSDVTIGAGSIVMPGVIINIGTKIGKGSIVNTGSVIEHDNQLGDYVHIASGVTTAGNVRIGNGTMLGTGTNVIQGIQIGKNTIIGAGSVVINNLPDNCTAVGVPAKAIKLRKEDNLI